MMKKSHLIIALALCYTSINAQENLVPNPSFEEVKGKPKAAGMVTMAEPWKAVTMNPVDLYVGGNRNEDFSVPKNSYGEEPAKTGSNYAGVSFFGYGARVPRSYLGTSLIKPLEAGKSYCMKFHVSLSDFSKYAVNNLAMYIANEEITEKSDGKLTFKPQIKSLKNEAFEKQYLWTPICGVYKANGGEQYIVIGNFNEDAETEQKKIRLSREFMGNRQQNNAYYFVDDVSVVELNEQTMADCMCDVIAGGKMEVEFKSFGTDESLRGSAKKTYLVNSDGSKAGTGVEGEEAEEFSLASAVLYYDMKADQPNAESAATLAQVAEYLNANPGTKIEIVGHIDASESAVSLLAKKRAFNLRKELQEMGVAADQLSHSSMEAKSPHESGKAEMNRRVTFIVK